MDLVTARALSGPELARRAKALAAFAEWCVIFLKATLDQVMGMDPPSLSKTLARFGQHLYDEGLSRFTLTYAILAVVDKKRELRRNLQQAWDVVSAWSLIAPVHSHLPWPAPWCALASPWPSFGDGLAQPSCWPSASLAC